MPNLERKEMINDYLSNSPAMIEPRDKDVGELKNVQPEAAKSFLPIQWKRASGHSVTDEKGKKYIDFTSGIFVANVGHNNLKVWNAMHRVPCLHAYNYSTEIREKYTEALCKKTGFECVALFSAGCEAVEAALRVMRHRWVSLGKIACIEGTYHGKTLGCRTDQRRARYGFPHLLHEIHEGMKPSQLSQRSIAGLMIESYRGWDAHFWDKQWIQDLRSYCTEHDILLCFDEIQSGFGRTGRFFCYEHYEVVPDLVCIGKAMGGGIPLSGLLGSNELLNLPGDLSSTQSGNPLACAAGLSVLKEIDRLNLVKEAERKGMILHRRLRFRRTPEMAARYDVNGLCMVAEIMMPSVEEANRVVMECYKRGLLVVQTGRESVKIGPPLVITDAALNKGLDILEGVLNG